MFVCKSVCLWHWTMMSAETSAVRSDVIIMSRLAANGARRMLVSNQSNNELQDGGWGEVIHPT
jgi:hypothetical protein